MKPFLLGLLLIPTLCSAQKLEFSLKGGIANNDIDATTFNKDYDVLWKNCYAASFAATVRIPLNIRVGLSVSANEVAYTLSPARFAMPARDYSYGKPVLSVGLILVERINIAPWKLDIDFGVTAGRCIGNTISYTSEGSTIDKKMENKWHTYGFVAGVQYNVLHWLGVGLETQPQVLNMGSKGTDIHMIPVMLKTSFRLKGRYD